MKRRTFATLMSSCAAGAVLASIGGRSAHAAPDASLLTTTLTPVGAERAGNAAGTIPAWTGGLDAIPAGIAWEPERTLPPDFFASDAMLYEVNASNMAQYAALLTDGVQHLIQERGLTLQVYPTHRTATAPQWVHDNAALNVTRAVLNPAGGRLGFSGAYGGTPFPIIDTSDPLSAGAQIIWNHEARWCGSWENIGAAGFVVLDGVVSLAQASHAHFIYPYHQQDGSPENYNGYLYQVGGAGEFAPANIAGEETVSYSSSSPLTSPNITWQLLAGQGRVRKAPEVLYDTPSSYLNGECNYDELFGFNGAADQYDWKYLGKQEMLIPYNNNKMFNSTSAVGHGPKTMNPDVIRWELHRVWVVEATLHPGKRNVLAKRKIYVDEDNWTIAIVDSWDASGNIFRHSQVYVGNFPNLPGTILVNNVVYNLQTNNYVSTQGPWIDEPYNTPWTFTPVPLSTFNPQTMAAAANY